MVDAGATNPRPEVVRQGGRAIAPPYVSYSTFRTMLEWLGSEGVPLRFDRSFWESKFSGSNGAQLSAALRFLGLLWDDEPNPELERLATATPYERRTTLGLLLIDSYLAVPFDELPRATPAMVRDWFRAYPIDGHTLRKAISFFVNAAKDTEFPLSNAVRKMAKSKSPAPSSKCERGKREARKTGRSQQSGRGPCWRTGSSTNRTDSCPAKPTDHRPGKRRHDNRGRRCRPFPPLRPGPRIRPVTGRPRAELRGRTTGDRGNRTSFERESFGVAVLNHDMSS